MNDVQLTFDWHADKNSHMAAAQRETADAIIQARLIKMQQAARTLDKPGAIWLQRHAAPDDLRALADMIDDKATAPDRK